jgi:hydrogenase maturation protease
MGNELLQDDGVGIHAVRLLQQQRPPEWKRNVRLAEVGVSVLDALDLFEWADYLVAIDAMGADRAPGTMYLATASDIEDWDPTGGLHEFSLVGALRMARKIPHVTILGVEPAIIDYGMELSEPLRAVLPQVVGETRKLVAALLEKGKPPSSLPAPLAPTR